MKNSVLYEINAHLLVRRFGDKSKLRDIPDQYFESLAQKGISVIWLMGVWQNCPDLVEQCCLSSDLISSYRRALPDWSKQDVIGSPYAIKDYVVHTDLGSMEDLLELKERINDLGMKLFLDFIPNHFGATTPLLDSAPDVFLHVDDVLFEKDSHTFFKHNSNTFAHGRDPMFPAWTDTVQVNYFSKTARSLMVDRLITLTKCCDGVRCDMAMLSLSHVFQNTWMGVLKETKQPDEEFWSEAIRTVKSIRNDFIFLAEAYWDLEWKLQKLGFDYTYDKRLLERLFDNDVWGVKGHLTADDDFQQKSVRFLENHDEQRAVSKFGEARSLAAATIVSTIKGMKFYFDGQFEGKKIKVPVQLGREPFEKVSKNISDYYGRLLQINSDGVFKYGEWKIIEPEKITPENYSFERFFSWLWSYQNQCRLVVINYSDRTAQCRIKFPFDVPHDLIMLEDLLTGAEYIRSTAEIKSVGLYVELKPYHSHIFSFQI
ncbi:MAG: glycosidase [Ignavibacteriaceae bacterium]|nr:glycosidase [Ignavibacteriaceae bacterium]